MIADGYTDFVQYKASIVGSGKPFNDMQDSSGPLWMP